ncbi:sigma-70 family RNA polymerase sigma factor [Arthrobacter yangruifuii]|uniref:Sigma-70 family RNA polymerase sigma factor n=1 Tax=Arthrobacter yangruifuii TaxID=2606616 RepID=A0A5N6MED7_9MICC|nr:sigma-70 family RNA polymerase sigma factor [Arthrobacter yangruifuii]KAD3456107.1 sigma-70 family RNA polymerase sigma factor [Arthrobacter yangruifuii]
MNRAARNAMVVENLPLVGYLVSEICAKATHLSRDDLASVGSIALITSADAFDPDLGVPFGAYARRRIIGAFADEMRSSDWATRSARRRIKETLAVKETLTAALGRTPNVDEIASALGVDRTVAEDALSDASRTVSSLDESVTDFLVADMPSPEGSLLASERVKYLQAAVAALPEKMRYVVEEIYFHDRSVKELAEELGSTHSAVSQQRAEAVRLLRDGLGTHYSDTNAAPELQSRIAPARRNAYLTSVGDRTAGGITRHHLAPAYLGAQGLPSGLPARAAAFKPAAS